MAVESDEWTKHGVVQVPGLTPTVVVRGHAQVSPAAVPFGSGRERPLLHGGVSDMLCSSQLMVSRGVGPDASRIAGKERQTANGRWPL